jgi:hypothetical protein
MLNSPKLNHYLNNGPTQGIIRIYNLDNDKSLLLKSHDIIKDSNSIRFQLDLGLYPNKALQKDYHDIGLELFAIEPIIILKDDDSLVDLLEKAINNLQSKNIELYN